MSKYAFTVIFTFTKDVERLEKTKGVKNIWNLLKNKLIKWKNI